MALWLHEAAHDAVDGVQALVARVGDERGNDGVVRPLARREHVGVALLQREVGAAVLQREAAAAWDDARAEAAVVTVDEGDAVAKRVRHGEVDSITVVVGRRAVVDDIGGALGIEDLRALGEVFGRDEFLCGHFLDVWVSHPPVGVGKGDTQRIDECV